ncbi:cell wall-binding repeat-containing protein [Alkalicoccus halolimnae]|uniref:Cell wall-binding repeat-containing protein n=1 Tax=Alkalicoccus halolimnae TaxID=1667239 RepID=A0AAJ8LTA3_9BACI
MKKRTTTLTGTVILSSVLLLAACGGGGEQDTNNNAGSNEEEASGSSAPMNNDNMPMDDEDMPMNDEDGHMNDEDMPMNDEDGHMNDEDMPMNDENGHMNDEDSMGGNDRESFEEEAAQLPEDFNENADQNLQTTNTKNITRLDAETPEAFSITASQTIWPATHEANQPGTIILADPEEWQETLAALTLVHHPNDGPLLLMEDGLTEELMAEIERLAPLGNDNGVEILAAATLSEEDEAQLEDYNVEQIEAEDPAAFAKEVEDRFADTIDERPDGVLIGSMNEEHQASSMIAGSWIAHMNESLLYVDESVPEATQEALEERDGEAEMYILGSEETISAEVEEELAEFGDVQRIEGESPAELSINFASYEDEEFGWGINEPGHGLVFASPEEAELALAGAPLAHLGKHAPMIWVEGDELQQEHADYLAKLKPHFEDAPMEGPYNHGYILGGEEVISFQTQGIIDDKMEIQPLGGGGHGMH